MILTTQCEHCGSAIEYESEGWHDGAVGDCPYCKQETRLRKIDIYEPVKSVANIRSELLAKTNQTPAKWKPSSSSSEITFFLLGFLLVFGSAALLLFSGNAINEVFCAIIGASGIFCWGVMAILGHLRNIAEKPVS